MLGCWFIKVFIQKKKEALFGKILRGVMGFEKGES
jgi:hypothetical protein